MLLLDDLKNSDFIISWTLIFAGVPYEIDRSVAVDYAIEKCLNGDENQDVIYLAGLSVNDINEIDKTLHTLSVSEKRNFNHEKNKVKLLSMRKKFQSLPIQNKNVQDLIEFWSDSGCPPKNGKYFGILEYSPVMITKYNYDYLYKVADDWIKKEINNLECNE